MPSGYPWATPRLDSAPCAPRPSATARSSSRSTPTPSRGRRGPRPRARGRAQRRRHPPARGRTTRRRPGAPQDIPGLELAGEVRRAGPGAERFAEGDRVMAIVGGGGQAELAVVHERQLMPVPDGLELGRGRRGARGLHHRPRRALHPGRAASGRAPARPRRRRRGRDGRGAARRARPARRSPRPCATRRCATRWPSSAPHEVIDPDGFAEHGPFDVVLELVGAPNLPGDLRALATGGRIVVIGVGGGGEGRAQPARADGQARDAAASTLRARPLEEKALTARAIERHVLPLRRAGALRSRSPRPSRSTRSPTPTSASPPAASSARSCWSWP